jgi:hypothetical protein
MSAERPSIIAPICLVVGALLGLAGSFAPSTSFGRAASCSPQVLDFGPQPYF